MRFPWTPKPVPAPRILPRTWQEAAGLLVVGIITGLGAKLVDWTFTKLQKNEEPEKAQQQQRHDPYARPTV